MKCSEYEVVLAEPVSNEWLTDYVPQPTDEQIEQFDGAARAALRAALKHRYPNARVRLMYRWEWGSAVAAHYTGSLVKYIEEDQSGGGSPIADIYSDAATAGVEAAQIDNSVHE